MNLNSLVALLGFQLAGELLHRLGHLPLSGPLLGMTLLFAWLVARGGPSTGMETTARSILASLALLFVPAGVGVIAHVDLIAAYWLPILVATFVGAAASLCAAAITFRLAQRLGGSAGAATRRVAGSRRPSAKPPAAPALDGEPQ